MKTFKTSHTEKAHASKETIWRIWSDVNNWPQWDVGLAACKFSGKFAAGNTFELTPQGAPESVVATLEVVEVNQRFSDKTDLGFATIEAIHEMKKEGKDLLVTHTIVAKVHADKAEFFEGKIWPGFLKGLPESVAGLVALAEKQEKNKS